MIRGTINEEVWLSHTKPQIGMFWLTTKADFLGIGSHH